MFLFLERLFGKDLDDNWEEVDEYENDIWDDDEDDCDDDEDDWDYDDDDWDDEDDDLDDDDDEEYDEDDDWEDEHREYYGTEVTPCGCTMFSCWECGSYHICGEQLSKKETTQKCGFSYEKSWYNDQLFDDY